MTIRHLRRKAQEKVKAQAQAKPKPKGKPKKGEPAEKPGGHR